MRKEKLHTALRKGILSGAIALGLLGLSTQGAMAVALKKQAILSGDSITLGDLFTGLEREEDKILGAAPHPGEDMVLDAHTLLRIAVALDLPWRPATTQDQIVIKREATVIDQPLIETALKDEITAQGMEGPFELLLPAQNAEIILPKGAPQTVEISSLKLLKDQDRFEAVLVAPSRKDPQHSLNISGTLSRLLSVPVLKTATQSGDVISAYDIVFIDVPVKTMNRDVVLKEEDLVGMTPRRILQPDKPVKRGDLQAPKLVSRGDMVTVILNNKGLNLTTQGKALQNGTKGETIRILNASSNKTIEGLITGSKEVTIQ